MIVNILVAQAVAGFPLAAVLLHRERRNTAARRSAMLRHLAGSAIRPQRHLHLVKEQS